MDEETGFDHNYFFNTGVNGRELYVDFLIGWLIEATQTYQGIGLFRRSSHTQHTKTMQALVIAIHL